MIHLTIVIVNWNVIELLTKCLDSIKQFVKEIDYEVIVVDNASEDNSVEIIQQDYPYVNLIVNQRNEGFARANNQGFAIAKGEYILILNPDTIVKENTIQKLLNILDENSEVGMVGPMIVDELGNITPACKRANISLRALFVRRFLLDKVYSALAKKNFLLRKIYDSKFSKSGFVPCISGACMFVRKCVLEKVGGFDESIPMYLDDNDLCYRFLKAGFKIFYCADSEIVHICGASVRKSKKPKLVDLVMFQATDVYLFKHNGQLFVFFHHVILFFSSIILLIIDSMLFPVILLFNSKYILSVIEKHYFGIRYSLLFKADNPNFKGYE